MYRNVVIDPPWKQKKGSSRSVRPNQTRKLSYETMDTKEIFFLLDLEIFPLCLFPHNVWMWTIDKFLPECESEMKARGYKLHARFIWDKMNGIAPAFTIRYSHEYLLWFYKSPMLPVEKSMRGKFKTVFQEKAREHSRKPNIAYSMIDALYPQETKLDVFSREKREGWNQWGDETTFFEIQS